MTTNVRPASVMPLERLPADMQEEIAAAVAAPRPPGKTIFLGPPDGPRPLAEMPSRAWHEWYWQRGLDPSRMRVSIPRWLRRAVIARDGYVCGLCDDPVEPADLQIDHVLPVAHGGTNDFANLQVAHATCNARKGARI